eukprot:scaffold22592_cov129-Cylindrotheca_fusiformis.AAC.27
MEGAKDSFSPLVAGILGGTVSTMMLLPLDNIKVRMQVHENRSGQLVSLRIVRGIIHHEGIVGLYQGLSPAIVGSSVSWGGFFFVYEGFKKLLRQRSGLDENSPLTPMANFQLACASGAVMVFLTNPIWLIKLRMQLQMKKSSERLQSAPKPYNGLFHAARTIVKEEGFFALYNGTGPALLLTSHGGVQFVVYEALKKHYHYTRARREPDGADSPVLERLEKSMGYLTMGAVAKIVASTATYPLQVVKARMQQRSSFVELTSDGNVRVVQRDVAGIIETSKRIWQKEGIMGYFKGCIPNAVRVAPSAAVTFVVYEFAMDFLSPL